jgi:indolepyruvate decarboxylase
MGTVIDYLLGRLCEIGVTDIFGVPGDFAFPIQDAIATHPDINWIGCCNELNAGYAADGYARVRGVAAISTTYGVGELGAISAVAGSYAEHLPVFHLTGMPNRATQADRAVVHHTLGTGEFELFRSMADAVVAASAILTPGTAVAEIERLIAIALTQRRPVYLAIPTDVVNADVLGEPPTPVRVPSDREQLGAAVETISGELDAAPTVCVLPGILLDRLGVADLARQFIEAADLPFATMFADKSVIDECHPNYLGMYDGRLMDEPVRDAVESSDLLIMIGSIRSDFNTGAFTARLDNARTIDIGLHATTVRGRVFRDVELSDLLAALAERGYRPRSIRHVRPDETTANPSGSDGDPITADQLYARWSAFIRPDDLVIAETGTVSMGLAFTKLPTGAKFYNQTLWGAIGWATPAALGAAVAAHDRRVLLFTGDGSHQLTAQEISQFHRLGLRPIVFVLNNSGYTIERLLCVDPEVPYNDVAPWRYAALPHALGCDDWFTARVSTLHELDEALHQAGTRDRAAYVEVVTAADEAPPLARQLHDNIATLYHSEKGTS